MNHPQRLDTSQVPNPRYSYMETPIEMSSPSRYPTPHLPSHADLTDINTNPPTVAKTSPSATNLASAQLQHAGQLRLQEEGIISSSNNGPPVHPALFAPYADDTGEQIPRPVPQASLPHSPGSLPVKQYSRSPPLRAMSIGPDSNPLQTPRSPPSARGTFQSIGLEATTANEAFPDHLPGQISHPEQEIKGGPWKSRLGECSDVGTCCLGLFCPCVLYGRTQYRLSRKLKREDPTNLLGYETCNGSCTAMTVFCGCQCLLAAIQHTRTRKIYGIDGTLSSDCTRAICCCCCTLIQDDREIRKREEIRAYSAQVTGTMLIAPYLPPRPMRYEAPSQPQSQ